MSTRKKIRDLKNQVNEVQGDISSLAQRGLRLTGKGEVYPLPVGEPQRTYMWEIMFLGTSRNFGNIRLYAKTATLPASSVETITRYYMGIPYNYAGKDDSEHTVTVTFWDNEDLEVYRFLQEWHSTIHEPGYGLQVGKNKYTKRMKVAMKDTTDLFTTGDMYYTDCFPSSVGEISLSYDDSNAIEFDATFTFDHKYAGKEQESAADAYLNPSGFVDAFTEDLDFQSVGDFVGNIGDFF